MNYLLDTHAFVWWNIDPSKLSPLVLQLYKNKSNQLFLSKASIWEMQIKLNLGKLTLPASLSTIIRVQRRRNSIFIMPIKLSHIYNLATLPNHHKDPFDRLLISQALVENLPLITSDADIAKYAVQTVW